MPSTQVLAGSTLAELDGGLLHNEPSIFLHIERGLKKNPDGVATIVVHQDGSHLAQLTDQHDTRDELAFDNKHLEGRSCLMWSYRQLHRAALKFGIGLLAMGVRPGMRIATMIPNRVEFPLLLWTAAILRVTLCSLDPGAVTKPRRLELKKFMTLNPSVIIVLDEEGANAVDEVCNNGEHATTIPTVKIVLEGEATSQGWRGILDIAAQGTKKQIDEAKLLEDARKDDPARQAIVLFTSGTTSGNPKGCPRSVAGTTFMLNPQIKDALVRGRMGPSTRYLASSANFRMIAPSRHYAVWNEGGCAVIPDPAAGIKGQIAAIRDHGITAVIFIPAILHAMVADPEFQHLDVSNVASITIAGDVITKGVYVKAKQSFPKATVAVAYGMTEVGGGLMKWPYYDMQTEQIPMQDGIMPIGNAGPGTKCRIRDPDTGQILKRGEKGELCLNCPSVIKHYLGHQHEDSYFSDPNTPGQERWFRTGDLAMVDQDGIVFVLGRIKDVIKRSGIPITPGPLENCIADFTGSVCSVLAWPHETLGQEPLAVIRSLGDRTDDDVRRQVLQMFGQDYALGPVLTLRQLRLEAFPLNATGKIMKTELLKLAKEYIY